MEELKAGKWLIQITGSEQGFREKKKSGSNVIRRPGQDYIESRSTS